MSKHYLFIVDTNEYSGNFERELVAYITGQVGECGVGLEEQCRFEEEVEDEALQAQFANIVAHVDFDDDGCLRPAMIWPTPGRLNNGRGFQYDDTPENRAEYGGCYPAYESVAAAFDERPSDEMIALMKHRAQDFMDVNVFKHVNPKASPTISGFRMVVREVLVSVDESLNEEQV